MSPIKNSILTAFAEHDEIRVDTSGDALLFRVGSTATVQEVRWMITDADLATLARHLSVGEKAAYGKSSGGFLTLITRLEEELLTFDGRYGDIVCPGLKDLQIQAS